MILSRYKHSLQNKKARHLLIGLPVFDMEEAIKVACDPEAVEFFSRNFLLIFMALNRFGWGATGVDEELGLEFDPKGTREGRLVGTLV